ncbi:TPA: serine hydrolase domain-containing protein [Stenotrophomonas maltophilia]|uniref:serine hydrolase domain-containing protein n=1 Tax=Stenotrophomonas maltophilia TaxID=40324 RepID=UPI000C155376|nr:serine hydrolase domain-containing protein [Stenotrophomonas maltophilia]EKT4104590.1 beta-lactamase family protein [Stenotrophomonas maltophilia]MBN5074607.1 beta-lactamase family protein [Stenotrophomonas maltophilia]MCU1184784.1 beta-lactamase family protein [Stenotrophomonas maltophilia]HDS1088971.1 beta-lactamase family protein [Stenotrophomonas maltophilia]HDX0794438.1 beta-lactamase family protein [Stenotrophomonas maltophilia]
MSTTTRNRQWLNAVVLCAVLLAVGCEGRKAPPNDVGAAVDEAAHALIEQPLLHSASIGVVYRGKTFIRHRGEMVAGKPDVPTDATLYEIGSLSKTLAGTLMARAVLEGRVGLEDDVRSYLQGDYPNLQYQGQPIRVRHLLSHTSGLPNMLPERANTVLEDFTDHRVPGELSALYAHYGKPDFLRDLHAVRIPRMPGKEYAYSSAGTELTAHILEGVYKTDYTSLLRGFFSDAAAMTSIGIKLGNAEKDRLAIGYHSDNPVPTSPMPQLPWGASGNVKATVPDMVKYLQFQLANGPVVQESHRTLARFDDEFSIGYFWNIVAGDRQKGVYYAHHGGVPRSQCYIYIMPEHDLGIFVITNQSGDRTARAMEAAIDTLVGRIAAR